MLQNSSTQSICSQIGLLEVLGYKSENLFIRRTEIRGRTSSKLQKWSERIRIARGGKAINIADVLSISGEHDDN